MTTLLSPGDDDIPIWLLKEYYSTEDPYLRSELLEAHGLTRDALRSYERRRAARERRLSTDSSQAATPTGREGSVSAKQKAVVVAYGPSTATGRIEFLFDVGAGSGRTGSWRFRSAPPSRGGGAAGPGRGRSGNRRQRGVRGRASAPLIRIVIVFSEN